MIFFTSLSQRVFKRTAFALIAFASVFAVGCDKPAATTVRPTVPAGTGIITGVVKFAGDKPPVKIIGGDCCPGASPVSDESLEVNENHTLKDCVIFIKDGPNVSLGELKDRLITQTNCQYVPHVLAMQPGQNLVITSHDATLHNVQTQSELNPPHNFSEAQGTSHSVNFEHPELVKLKCDVHPWMTAYAYVFDHPFFAVSDDQGRFEIDHLPTGTYTLVVWQEKLEPQQMQVTISNDKPSEVAFEYRTPG